MKFHIQKLEEFWKLLIGRIEVAQYENSDSDSDVDADADGEADVGLI